MTNFEVLQEYEKAGVPLPRLEEWQVLKAQLAEHKEYCCCQKNEALLLENARLKGLLKECKAQIDILLDSCISFDEAMCFEQGCKWSEETFRKENKDVYELLEKINEVLK